MKLPKIILLLALSSWLFTFITSPVLAENEVSTGGGGIGDFQQQLNNCANSGSTSLECWVAGNPEQTTIDEGKTGKTGVLYSVGYGIINMFAGPISQTPEGAYIPGGAIKSLAMLITSLSQPPVSTKEYLAYLGRKLNIVKPAYAQGGFGFGALNSLLSLWNAFKNLAYLLFIAIFIITGFSIMFRAKIDPQTIISIQNALPRIVVGLILVTFSYAIAGLMVDLIYVLFFLTVGAVQAFGGITPVEASAMTTNYTTASLFGTLASLGKIGYNDLRNLLLSIIPGAVGSAAHWIIPKIP